MRSTIGALFLVLLLSACTAVASPSPAPTTSHVAPTEASTSTPAAISTPGSTPSPSPTGTPGGSISPAPVADWTGLRWQPPVLTQPLETISDAVAWDGGYVAVGQFQNDQGGAQAVAWFSPDWRTWTRTLLDTPAAGHSVLLRVLALPDRLVAIGTSGEEHCVPPEGEGQVCDPLPIAVWISTDGRMWQPAAVPDGFAGMNVDAVAVDGERLVLAGDRG